ncbi:RraA family protein [[Eubacterium] cellulosolvens]
MFKTIIGVEELAMSDISKLIEGIKRFDTAKISDILDDKGFKVSMSSCIKPLWEGLKICGPAVTVEAIPSTSPNTGPALFNAIDSCAKGDIIVIGVGEDTSCDSWGGLVTRCALKRGIGGVITDGPARDFKEIKECGFPVFSYGLIPASPKGRRIYTGYDKPIICGGVPVNPKDIILGDDDGVVVVPREKAESVIEIATKVDEAEKAIIEDIEKGLPAKEALTKKRKGMDII